MTISIDGKMHRTFLYIKFGQDFPRKYSNRKLYISGVGDVLVYITDVGVPQWTEKMTVKIKIWYYITQIYREEPKKNKLTLVK
ncbi:hypothetical protein MUB24_17350 [Lederbergia sp. NSJ-179]|uniref:hypothetical protein n=1 Tax=Lederbergia sp. NSJ-179 TaxID=2931402 RepID=UPI001FD211EB|nr:hypothetical protein [Lederbergia sp. NSJ-179]MCJ7842632.1 hypothetical protein [Lederbergia sp. NSJ-179]